MQAEDYFFVVSMCTDNIHKQSLIFSRVGPVSSLHDRACELYYSLIGGTGNFVLLRTFLSQYSPHLVDYGKEHSAAYGHSQYGRTTQGLYPQWSSENPLHFLGHSIVRQNLSRYTLD